MSEKNWKTDKDVTKQMKKAAAELNFEAAAELRDKLIELKSSYRIWKVRSIRWQNNI